MKRIFLLLGLVYLGIPGLQAQEAKKCFINMPDSLSPLLTSVNRADCVDFMESKMKAEVSNRFGSKSEMTELSADYIRIQMTPQTSWQMKLLATSDTTKVICVISTACAPVCDSDFAFYTTDWKPLPASSFLTLPTKEDFFTASDSALDFDVQLARQHADMFMMKADLSAKDNKLTLTFTTPEYMNKEAAEKLKPILRHPIVFVWKEGRFVSEGD